MNIAVKLRKRNFIEEALKPRERKMEQIKNRPHTENVDSQEEDRLNPEFERIIKEIIDDCKAIKQILHEAKQAAATDAGFFGGDSYQRRAMNGVKLSLLSDWENKYKERRKATLNLFKFSIKFILGFFIIIIGIIAIPIGSLVWLPALLGAGKRYSE